MWTSEVAQYFFVCWCFESHIAKLTWNWKTAKNFVKIFSLAAAQENVQTAEKSSCRVSLMYKTIISSDLIGWRALFKLLLLKPFTNSWFPVFISSWPIDGAGEWQQMQHISCLQQKQVYHKKNLKRPFCGLFPIHFAWRPSLSDPLFALTAQPQTTLSLFTSIPHFSLPFLTGPFFLNWNYITPAILLSQGKVIIFRRCRHLLSVV